MGTTRERLAEMLKQSRLDAGFKTHSALARELGVVRPVVGKAENPRNPPPSIDTVTRWAKATHVDAGPLVDLVERCRSGNPEWFVPYVRAESVATSLRLWGPLLVPGPVQTRDYAQAILETGGYSSAELAVHVTERMERQRVVGRAHITMALDHSVLLRPLGGPLVMAEQCERVLELAEDNVIRAHIVPYGTNIGLYGAFDIAIGNGNITTNLNSLRDVSSTEADLAEECLSAFDDILASALPRNESVEYIRTQRDMWKEQAA
jgi:transcriptional regulator with XRE-family HTH domain